MDDIQELYQETILDHNRNPNNYGTLDNANHKAEGFNPLCGDHYRFYMDIDNGTIKDIRFEGSGCAISKSSASIMTTLVKGKSTAEAEVLIKKISHLLTDDTLPDLTELGKLAVFAGVREFPVRVKCASLAWHTLKSALDNKNDVVSTE